MHNLFLMTVLSMMLARHLISVSKGELVLTVSGTILVIFLLSLEIKTNLINTVIIFFAPFLVFILLLFFVFDTSFDQHMWFSNIYPMVILGFMANRIQNNLNFKVFKSNFLLNSEEERTSSLYQQTLVQNEKLNQKNKEVEIQKNKIKTTHEQVINSVSYAKYIQTAMFPKNNLFSNYFADYFILFKPRDIVSGDFYWAKKINNTLIYATADCTGHGVAGAMVSMLGMSLLNEVVSKPQNNTAARILDDLRNSIKASLKQKDEESINKDGMDIALCLVNLETKELQFAGAYNPLYIVRAGKLIELKADRQPIAIHIKEKAFTNHVFNLQKDDILYTFSDGFADQFNGKTQEKFKIKRFRELLLKNSKNTLNVQRHLLEQTLSSWQGKAVQVDDILVVGVKIN